jgi:sec-independent protein translocase protein TatB
MFDIAWSELLIIGGVALVVIGPKDLPKVLRTAGMMVNKARGLAREFQNGLDEMVRESELEELRKKADISGEAKKILDPDGDLARMSESLNNLPEPAPAQPVALPTAAEPFTPPPAVEEPVQAAQPQAEPQKPANPA